MAIYQKFGLLAQGGALADADALIRALPEDQPDPGINAFSRGALGVYLGHRDRARADLERATALRPGHGEAWLSWSATVDFAREPDQLDRLVAARPVLEAGPAGEQAVYCYALGKAHADLGDHAAAFAAFARGAALKKALLGYDRAADAASAAEAVRGYDRQRLAELAGRQREATARTIFVTGLPRSGTTLVEQILASHSQVADGGEINLLRVLAREVGGADLPALAAHVWANGPESAARLWDHWLTERFRTPARVVDKSLETSRFLGLAAGLLPDAPVIWLTRDPLDCAWSCFRTHFLGGVNWSHDLADIAWHFRLEEGLLRAWREVLGERLLVLPYEALVTDPAGWIPRILTHCGLAQEPQVFAPHENRRVVSTSSVLQVRRPIGTGAIGASAPYRRYLAPFLEAYGCDCV